MAWLLMPTVLAGGSEVVGHVTGLLLLSAAILATVAIALRIGLEPLRARLAGLFMLSMPALLGMSATVMPDVAAMAFGAIGIERSLAFSTSRRWLHGATAALALGLAPLARIHLVWLLGAAFLLLLDGPPLAWRSWIGGWRPRYLPILIAPLVTLLVIRLGKDAEGGGIASAALSFASADRAFPNAVAFFSHWGWSMSFALGWCLFHYREVRRERVLWAAVPLSLWIVAEAGKDGRFLLTVVVALGMLALAGAIGKAFRDNDSIELGLAFWLFAAFPLLLYTHLPPKYHVASAPAAALLLARAVEWEKLWPRLVTYGLMIFGIALGLLIVRADANMAGIERRAVAQEIAPRIAAGKRVWFSGHWGFQWYAERAGARPLVLGQPRVRRGDIVLVDEQAFNQGLIELYPNRELLGTVEDSSPGGRIMNPEANAGFYSNEWGDKPWTWSRTTAANRISIWLIR